MERMLDAATVQGSTPIPTRIISRVATRCWSCVAFVSSASCTSAGRSPRSPTRCSSRRRAVSQQLAMLEREAGVKLIEKAGRGVRLTDPGLVLAEHADALLRRTALAEADLAAAANEIAGRGRIAAFQSAAFKLALPAIAQLRETAPRLRCELFEAEPETALPALALGDLDVVIGDEWDNQPWPLADQPHPLPAAARPRDARGQHRAAAHARRPGLGRRAPEHGVDRRGAPHLPRARRLRARHPAPLQRRQRRPRARRAPASRSRCCRSSCSRPARFASPGAVEPHDLRRDPRDRRAAPEHARPARRHP